MKNAAIITLCLVIIAAYFAIDVAFCGCHHMASAAELLFG